MNFIRGVTRIMKNSIILTVLNLFSKNRMFMKMRKLNIALVFIFCVSLFSCSDNNEYLEDVVDESNVSHVVKLPDDAVNGELFIKFKPEVEDILEAANVISVKGVRTRSNIPSVDQILNIAGSYTFERVFPVDKRNEDRTRKTGLHLWYIVRFDKDADLEKVANDMASLAEVATVEYNREIKRSYRTDVKAKPAAMTLSAENDGLSKQWALINNGSINGVAPSTAAAIKGKDINWKEATKKCTGDPSIIVAVMDEGVMYNHVDLQANMWRNTGEEHGSNEDHDGNGYAGDYYGYNFATNSGLITYNDINDVGHGTHVAGIIAADNKDGNGVYGVAGGSDTQEGVKIMSLQIFSGNSGATMLQEAKAVKYAADNGAVILQCSWGYNSGYANPNNYVPGFLTDEEYVENCTLEKEVFDYFINYAGDPNGTIEGGLVIFAAGNEYAPLSAYPGAYKDYVCVASVGPDGLPASYSNYATPSGNKNMITAPGGDLSAFCNNEAMIYSTMPTMAIEGGDPVADGMSGYGYMEGTSMACPYVSGVAALGLSYAAKLRKHYRAEDFRQMLLESVISLEDTLKGEKSYWYGWSDFPESSIHIKVGLSNYRNKIGGLVDANKLLENIENGAYGAQPMRVPNVSVAVDGTYTIKFERIFKEGVTATDFDVIDSSIAAVELANNCLTVKGVKMGVTKASVEDSDGNKHDFTITVSLSTGNGWM